MSRIVTSEAGEKIEVFDNEEWLELTDGKEHSLRQWNARGNVILAAWLHGEFASETGQATVMMHKLAHELGYAGSDRGMVSLFMIPVFSQCFKREIRGRRCFSIKLVMLPEKWHTNIVGDMRAPSVQRIKGKLQREAPEARWLGPQQQELPAELLPQELPPPVIEPADNDLKMANAVAASLLNQVIELVQAGPNENERRRVEYLEAQLEGVKRTLADRLEENERFRKANREMGDELRAVKAENVGLRQRLQQAENNLQNVLKPDTRTVVAQKMQAELDRLMRQTPTQKGE